MKDILFFAQGYDGWEQPREDGSGRQLVLSCQANDITLHTYGTGPWAGHLHGKLTDAARFLRTRSEDIVLFMDTYDSLVFGNAHEIWSNYTRMGSPPILFSAEKNCWPQWVDASRYAGTAWESTSPWGYLNGGGWMGRRDYIIDAIERMLKNRPSLGDDMTHWHESILLGELPEVKVDSGCVIFQTMCGTEEGELAWSRTFLRPFNDVHKTFPQIVHWNGRAKGREEWFALAYGAGVK